MRNVKVRFPTISISYVIKKKILLVFFLVKRYSSFMQITVWRIYKKKKNLNLNLNTKRNFFTHILYCYWE